MINPIIFTIKISQNFSFSLRWYGVLVMTGIIVATFLAEREVRRRGEDGTHVWNLLVWLIIAGVVGARLWYVGQSILTGNPYYLENPVQILQIWQGGLHFYGALLFGMIALIIYVRKYKVDLLLMLDSLAPMLLIGQAIARPANFINQELYGQPTTLPWGIPIDAAHRIAQYSNLTLYPVATTRFHPTFAYEMIWNFLAAALLLWLAHRLADKLKPGTIFAGWLILAGIGRALIETFRPDQPLIPGTGISYSRFFALLMALAGVLCILVIQNIIRLPRINPWREKYFLAPPLLAEKPKSSNSVSEE